MNTTFDLSISSSGTKRTLPSDDLAPHRSGANQVLPGIPTPAERLYESQSLPHASMYEYSFPSSSVPTSVQVSPLGFLVTASEAGEIHVWSLGWKSVSDSTLTEQMDAMLVSKSSQYHHIAVLNTHSCPIIMLAVSPDGHFAVAVGADCSVVIIDLATLSVFEQFDLPCIPSSLVLVQGLMDPAVQANLQTETIRNTRFATTTLAACFGTVTGHLFVFPISPVQRTSVFVSKLSLSSPITNITAIPVAALISNGANLRSGPLATFPSLSDNSAFVLAVSDLSGMIDLVLLPYDLCTNLSVTSLLEQSSPSMSNFDTILHFDSPTEPSSIDAPIRERYANSVQSANAHQVGKLVLFDSILFWGSLTTNILPQPFNTPIIPSVALKSQTDLFFLRKEKLQSPISMTFTPNGAHLLFATVIGTTTREPEVEIVVMDTSTLKIAYRMRESAAQYPSRNFLTIAFPLNEAIFRSQPRSALPLENLVSSPFTTSNWNTVSLSPVAASQSVPSPDIPNPFYCPPSLFITREGMWIRFIKASVARFESLSDTLRCLSIPTSPFTGAARLRWIQSVVTSAANESAKLTFQQSFRPLQGVSGSSSPHQVGGLLSVNQSSQYLSYPSFFGVKTVRLRDGFTVISPSDPVAHQHNQTVGPLGSVDMWIQPEHLISSICPVLDSWYTRKQAESAQISLLLSHHERTLNSYDTQGHAHHSFAALTFDQPILKQYPVRFNGLQAIPPTAPPGGASVHSHDESSARNLFALTTVDIEKLVKTRFVRTGALRIPTDAAGLKQQQSNGQEDAFASTALRSMQQSNTQITATVHTTDGDITFRLFPNEAPKACENFLRLAESGYFDGIVFHRIIKGFCVQTGDPTGKGRGGQSIWGSMFEDEFSPKLTHSSRGVVSMANAGPNTNGSQFFFTLGPQQHLDGKHSIFGMVSRGFDTLDRLEAVRVDMEGHPVSTPPNIKSVSIHITPPS